MTLAQILAFLISHPNIAGQIDRDGDGYSRSVDCDDRDPNTNPDAIDVAFDGLDQNCDGVYACEFEVTDVDGFVTIMPNELEVVINPLSPEGDQAPGIRQELLRFDVTAVHADCPEVIWESANAKFEYSDNAISGWDPLDIELVNLSVDPVTPIVGPRDLGGHYPLIFGLTTNVVIAAGDTNTMALYANTLGASTADDDTIRVDISASHFSSLSEHAYIVEGTEVIGNEIQF